MGDRFLGHVVVFKFLRTVMGIVVMVGILISPRLLIMEIAMGIVERMLMIG
jgi:hypothetical protein